MPLVYLALAVAMMFAGGMLMSLNPAPLEFAVGWGGQAYAVRASIVEILGGAMLFGAAVIGLFALRAQWASRRLLRTAQRAQQAAEQEAVARRREALDATSRAALIGAQLTEMREAYQALEAEARPLLTMRHNRPPEPISAAEPAIDVTKAPAPSSIEVSVSRPPTSSRTQRQGSGRPRPRRR